MIEKRIIRTIEEVEYTFYDGVDNFGKYKELLKDLHKAEERDIFTLRIASPGGRVDVGTELVNAVQESNARVIARITSSSASMASILALACDDLIIDEYQTLMFHTYSTGTYGKSQEISSYLEHTHDSIVGWMNNICYPFLTKPELERLHRGEDIYIKWNCPTLEARIKRHYR